MLGTFWKRSSKYEIQIPKTPQTFRRPNQANVILLKFQIPDSVPYGRRMRADFEGLLRQLPKRRLEYHQKVAPPDNSGLLLANGLWFL